MREPWGRAKGGGIEDGSWAWAGWGKAMLGKWRQLYSNISKKKKKVKKRIKREKNSDIVSREPRLCLTETNPTAFPCWALQGPLILAVRAWLVFFQEEAASALPPLPASFILPTGGAGFFTCPWLKVSFFEESLVYFWCLIFSGFIFNLVVRGGVLYILLLRHHLVAPGY